MNLNEIDVVILCGGRGARLGALTVARPKPLLPVGGQPFLLRLMRQMAAQGFMRFVLAVHYRAEQFESFRHAYRHELPETQVVVEPEPMGTGGEVRHALPWIRSRTCLVLNGDSWVSQPLAPMLAQHRQGHRALTAMAVSAGRVQGQARDKGVWTVGPRGEIRGFETIPLASAEWVNAGVYLMERAIVTPWPQGCYRLEDCVSQRLARRRTGVFHSPGFLLDIGTPDCYAWANQVFHGFDIPMPSGAVSYDPVC